VELALGIVSRCSVGVELTLGMVSGCPGGVELALGIVSRCSGGVELALGIVSFYYSNPDYAAISLDAGSFALRPAAILP